MSLRDRIRARCETAREHPGQVLVIFAITLPILIAMLGFGLDTAHLYRERRDLQDAVDLAALGGASQLPNNASAGEAIAVDLATRNGASSASARAGYQGDNTKLEVSASRSVGLFFMPVLGMDSVTVTARAVAEHSQSEGTSIFSKKDYHCWIQSIWVTGSNITINGDAHTNSAMTWSGSGNKLTGSLTYQNDELACAGNVNMGSARPPAVPAPQPTAHREWPINYKPSDFPCTYTLPSSTNGNVAANGNWWVGGTMASNRKLKDGVICYTGSSWMTLDADDITGNVTFVAKLIKIDGARNNFTAFKNGVVVYSTSANYWPAIQIIASGGSMTGTIYQRDTSVSSSGYGGSRKVQGGQTIINGSSGFILRGALVGWTNKLEGSGWTITGSGTGLPEPMRLVE